MKTLVIIFVSLVISSQAKSTTNLRNLNYEDLSPKELNNAEERLLEVSFQSKLEKIRQTLKKGNETLGVPVCDPYQMNHFEKNINMFNGSINGSTSLDDLLFTGLSGYKIIKADISIFKRTMNLKLKWPRLEGASFYVTNAYIKNKMIEVYGGGDFEVMAQDFVFETVAYFGLRNGKVYIKNMNTKISLQDFKFTIRGLYYDDGISKTVSIFITELVKQVFQENQKILVDVVNNFIIVNANNYLSNMSFQDLLNLLS